MKPNYTLILASLCLGIILGLFIARHHPTFLLPDESIETNIYTDEFVSFPFDPETQTVTDTTDGVTVTERDNNRWVFAIEKLDDSVNSLPDWYNSNQSFDDGTLTNETYLGYDQIKLIAYKSFFPEVGSAYLAQSPIGLVLLGQDLYLIRYNLETPADAGHVIDADFLALVTGIQAAE